MSSQKEKTSIKKVEKKSERLVSNKHTPLNTMDKQHKSSDHKKSHDSKEKTNESHKEKTNESHKEKTNESHKEKTNESHKEKTSDSHKEKTSDSHKEKTNAHKEKPIETKKEVLPNPVIVIEKPKKPSKYAGIDKGDKKNKETAYAELNFDVKETKRWMAKYFKVNSNRDYIDWLKNKRTTQKREENPDVEIDEEKIGRTSIKNAHFALGFIEEILCIKLVDMASEDAKKSKVKTYIVTENDIRNVIRCNSELNYTFGRFLDLYNRDEDYESTMKLSRKTVYKFVDERSAMGTSVQLDDHALNMLLFILHQNRVILSISSYNKMMYSKKSSVDYRGVMYSVFDHYTGKLRDLLYKKLESKIKLFAKTNFSDDEEEGEIKTTLLISSDSENESSDDEE